MLDVTCLGSQHAKHILDTPRLPASHRQRGGLDMAGRLQGKDALLAGNATATAYPANDQLSVSMLN